MKFAFLTINTPWAERDPILQSPVMLKVQFSLSSTMRAVLRALMEKVIKFFPVVMVLFR